MFYAKITIVLSVLCRLFANFPLNKFLVAVGKISHDLQKLRIARLQVVPPSAGLSKLIKPIGSLLNTSVRILEVLLE
jgi:hypothetical protein